VPAPGCDLIAASGLTQRDYAERIGLDATKLSKSLTGGRRFTSLELARISELANFTVDWLITGAEPEPGLTPTALPGSPNSWVCPRPVRLFGCAIFG
jgi:transcriptional regulator with XRE-family HTH domain